jgi:hypothetical protein
MMFEPPVKTLSKTRTPQPCDEYISVGLHEENSERTTNRELSRQPSKSESGMRDFRRCRVLPCSG